MGIGQIPGAHWISLHRTRFTFIENNRYQLEPGVARKRATYNGSQSPACPSPPIRSGGTYPPALLDYVAQALVSTLEHDMYEFQGKRKRTGGLTSHAGRGEYGDGEDGDDIRYCTVTAAISTARPSQVPKDQHL